jgi:hypothetical protein
MPHDTIQAREGMRDVRPVERATTSATQTPIPALRRRPGVPYPLDYLRLSLEHELREITSNCVSS